MFVGRCDPRRFLASLVLVTGCYYANDFGRFALSGGAGGGAGAGGASGDAAAGQDGSIAGGFTPQASGVASSLQAVWGTGPGSVYAVGESGVILHTVDGGRSWARIPQTVSGSTLFGIWGSADDDLFVVGQSATILHYDGLAWRSLPSNLATPLTLTAVWGASNHDVYAVGQHGTIIHYDGARWTGPQAGPMTDGDLFGLWGANGGNIYAIGTFVSNTTNANMLLHSTGNGTWTEEPVTGGWGDLHAIWFVGAEAWAAGITNFHGPATWHLMPGGTLTIAFRPPNPLNGIWGSTSGVFYAAGDVGGLYRLLPGGSWTAIPLRITNALYGIWGSGPDDVYVVGAGGVILHGP